MLTIADPRVTLLCLSLLHEPGEMALKNLRTVFAISQSELNSNLNWLRDEGLLAKSRHALSVKGIKALRSSVSPVLIKPTKDPVRNYRAYVSSILLKRDIDPRNLDSLSDGTCLCAALAARLCNHRIELPVADRGPLINVAARVVIQSFLNDLSPTVSRSPLQALGVENDPLLLDLFEAASGHRTLDAGFRALAARALKTSLIPASDARWRKISKAGFDSMAPSPLHQRQNLPDVATLASVVDRVARATPTGWVSIFKAFEAYRDVNRVSLAEFKLAVEAAARTDKLELAPLNVPSLQNDNERAQSALVMGGLTYHLVRLPK